MFQVIERGANRTMILEILFSVKRFFQHVQGFSKVVSSHGTARKRAS